MIMKIYIYIKKIKINKKQKNIFLFEIFILYTLVISFLFYYFFFVSFFHFICIKYIFYNNEKNIINIYN